MGEALGLGPDLESAGAEALQHELRGQGEAPARLDIGGSERLAGLSLQALLAGRLAWDPETQTFSIAQRALRED